MTKIEKGVVHVGTAESPISWEIVRWGPIREMAKKLEYGRRL
jgi:hypothetical protein